MYENNKITVDRTILKCVEWKIKSKLKLICSINKHF